MSRPRPIIEVPRLGEAARQRMRSGVFERLDRVSREAELKVESARVPVARTGRTWRIAALASASAAALCLVVALVLANGLVRSHGRQDGQGASFSRLVTTDAPSRVTVGDAELDLAAHSSLTVTESPGGGVHLVLEQGHVHCVVAPRGSRPPFIVSAADVRVEVVGTRFGVSREGDRVAVAVEKGVVRVIQGGEVRLVPAGHTWPRAAVERADASGGPTAEPSASVDMAPLVLDHPEGRGRARHTSRAGRVARGNGDGPDHDRGADRDRDEPDHDRGADRDHDGGRAPAPAASPAVPDARSRYDRAAGLESTHPADALAIYRDLVAGGGAWAANALFAEARLELDLGHRGAARSLLESYLQRYPHGINAAVARRLLARLR